MKLRRRSAVAEYFDGPARLYGRLHLESLEQRRMLSTVSFDPAAEWSATDNPNGAWTYGWSQSLGTTFNPSTILVGQSGITGHTPDIDGTLAPVVSHNDTEASVTIGSVTWPADGLVLHPGPTGEVSILRFTAPSDGIFDVLGGFTSQDSSGATTDVHVLHNGASVFDGPIGEFLQFSETFAGAAGDTIDFAVGYGNGRFSSDSTGLDATVRMSTNEPPVAINDTGTTVEDNPVVLDVLANDSDPDGDTLTVVDASVSGGFLRGQVAITPDSRLAFKPFLNFRGGAVINYTVSDGRGGTATADVSVTVLSPLQAVQQQVVSQIDSLVSRLMLTEAQGTRIKTLAITAVSRLGRLAPLRAITLLSVARTMVRNSPLIPAVERDELLGTLTAVILALQVR